MQDIAAQLIKKIPQGVAVGIYDFEKEREEAVVTLLPGHDPEKAARVYSFIYREIAKALSYLPSEVGGFKNLSVISGKAVFFIYSVPETPYILVAAIPREGNVGLAKVMMEKSAKEMARTVG